MPWKDKILTLDDLIGLIGNTQVFFAERLYDSDSIGRSVQVFLLGFVVSLPLVSGIGNKVGVPSTPHEQLVVSSLIYIFLLGASITVAWRSMGIHHNLRVSISALFYCFSVITPLSILLIGLFVASIEQDTIGSSLLLYTFLGLLIFWTVRVWRAFSLLKLHSRFQAIGALFIFLILAYISSEAISSVSTVMG